MQKKDTFHSELGMIRANLFIISVGSKPGPMREPIYTQMSRENSTATPLPAMIGLVNLCNARA